MNTKNCKAKGRRCAAEVKELMHKYAADLKPDDISITLSGDTGPDLKLSPAAQQVYPFATECKNKETLNIWKALKQADGHLEYFEFPMTPVVFFKRNHSKLYIALEAEEFMRLVR